MLGLAALPPLVPLVCYIWLPESPRHLILTGRYSEARALVGRRTKCLEFLWPCPDRRRLVYLGWCISLHVQRRTTGGTYLTTSRWRASRWSRLVVASKTCSRLTTAG